MKKRIVNTVAITILILFFGMLSSSVQKTKAAFPAEFYIGEKFVWDVEYISAGNIQWYNSSSYALVTNWYADIDEQLKFNVTDYTIINNQKHLVGDISVGNLSLTTNNEDIGFNLALSVYPWYGGLLTLFDNWTHLSSSSPFTGTNAGVSLDGTTTALGLEVESITINIDDGFQKSKLVYEKYTGLLLEANTSSGAFDLILKLASSTIPLPSITNGLSVIIFPISLVSFLSFMTIRKQIKRSKNE